MDIESLCLEIAKVEDGNQVIQILKGNNLWEDEDCWALVGSKPGEDYEGNNHATIGNQQSNPSNALVEKLVNCGDSALLLKCFEKGIDPKSADAPDNVRDAIEKFFNVRGGRWINAPDKDRTLLGKKFCNLVATGEKGRNSNPMLTIIDSAEGQHPNDFYKTFMSLTLKNKVGIKFVQGKFGMGSFGAVNFCTVDGLQLIISKRNPKLIEDDKNNPFGFTVVRKIEPEGNYKSSRWVYLVIDGKITSFERDYLDLMPGKHPDHQSHQVSMICPKLLK